MNLTDLRRHADQDVQIGTDATTPDGTFYGITKMLGITTTYLLAGDPNSPDTAEIIGRIEYTDRGTNPYIGNRIKGGELTYRDEGEADTFARMLAAHQAAR